MRWRPGVRGRLGVIHPPQPADSALLRGGEPAHRGRPGVEQAVSILQALGRHVGPWVERQLAEQRRKQGSSGPDAGNGGGVGTQFALPDCCQHCCQCGGQGRMRHDDFGTAGKKAATGEHRWTVCPILRIRCSERPWEQPYNRT